MRRAPPAAPGVPARCSPSRRRAALLVGGGTAAAVGPRRPRRRPARARAVRGPRPPRASPTRPPRPAPTPSAAARPARLRPPSRRAASPTADRHRRARPPPPPRCSVSIPSIGVSSPLLHLGLQADGTLEVPEGDDFDTAAWYDGSPRPGDVGPGRHRGPREQRRPRPVGVLRAGEHRGRRHASRWAARTAPPPTFEVYDVQQFPKDGFPTLQVYGNTAGPELRLITCGGTIAESTAASPTTSSSSPTGPGMTATLPARRPRGGLPPGPARRPRCPPRPDRRGPGRAGRPDRGRGLAGRRAGRWRALAVLVAACVGGGAPARATPGLADAGAVVGWGRPWCGCSPACWRSSTSARCCVAAVLVPGADRRGRPPPASRRGPAHRGRRDRGLGGGRGAALVLLTGSLLGRPVTGLSRPTSSPSSPRCPRAAPCPRSLLLLGLVVLGAPLRAHRGAGPRLLLLGARGRRAARRHLRAPGGRGGPPAPPSPRSPSTWSPASLWVGGLVGVPAPPARPPGPRAGGRGAAAQRARARSASSP